MAPKVSILIPTYNREHILDQTIQSALNQDYDNFEIIICDNASTDKSWEIITEFAKKHSKIRAFRNEENLGAVRNWVACLNHAEGEFAKILWSDDLMSPEFLKSAIPLFTEDIGFVYSAVNVFSDDTGKGEIYYKLGRTGAYSSSVYIEGKLSGEDFPSSPGCAVFRLKDLRENLLTHIPVAKGVNVTPRAVGNDLLIYLLVARKYPKFYFLEEPLNQFRVHGTSITISSKKGELMYMYQLVESYFVDKTQIDIPAFRKFNAKLLLSIWVFRGTFGIKKINDFYQERKIGFFDVSYIHIFRLFFILFKRKILKIR